MRRLISANTTAGPGDVEGVPGVGICGLLQEGPGVIRVPVLALNGESEGGGRVPGGRYEAGAGEGGGAEVRPSAGFAVPGRGGAAGLAVSVRSMA